MESKFSEDRQRFVFFVVLVSVGSPSFQSQNPQPGIGWNSHVFSPHVAVSTWVVAHFDASFTHSELLYTSVSVIMWYAGITFYTSLVFKSLGIDGIAKVGSWVYCTGVPVNAAFVFTHHVSTWYLHAKIKKFAGGSIYAVVTLESLWLIACRLLFPLRWHINRGCCALAVWITWQHVIWRASFLWILTRSIHPWNALLKNYRSTIP